MLMSLIVGLGRELGRGGDAEWQLPIMCRNPSSLPLWFSLFAGREQNVFATAEVKEFLLLNAANCRHLRMQTPEPNVPAGKREGSQNCRSTTTLKFRIRLTDSACQEFGNAASTLLFVAHR